MRDTDRGTSVVLLYHRMGLPRLPSLVAGQYISPRLFGWSLDYMLRRGWKGASLAEAVDGDPDTERRFSVTFDDGYQSVYRWACPVLVERGLTASIYVVAGSIGGANDWDRRIGDVEERVMSAEQIRELAELGFEIGSHTMTHPRLTRVPPARLEQEIRDSKHILEDVIGRPVTSFSYPYGDCSKVVRDAAAAAGYRYAVGTRLGVITAHTDPFAIPRVNVRWNGAGPVLAAKIERARRASEETE